MEGIEPIISESDIKEIKRLLNLKIVDMGDKNSAQAIINKYKDPGGKWCMTCDPAVRHMFNILRDFAASRGITP